MTAELGSRYTTRLRRLHWVIALLMLAAYVLIEQRGLFPRGSDGRVLMMQGHFWAGVAILALALWRIVARVRDGAPPITPPLGRGTALAAKAIHGALYAFLIIMPVLGLATAWTDGKQVLIPFTAVALPALLAPNEGWAHSLEDLHGAIGEAFYWVIGAHVVAAFWHHWIKRDDTLRRMV